MGVVLTGMSTRATTTTSGTDRLATFRLDVEYTRTVPAFEGAGIETILLKGPAFDRLLFGGTRSRSYADIDLLVDPARRADVNRVMVGLGFQPSERDVASRLGWRLGIAVGLLDAPHATPWVRERDQFTIDVHHTLPEIAASPEEVWRALDSHRLRIAVVETQVEALDGPASALLIALHAAHHGPGWHRAQTDLAHASEVLDAGCWREAARLARDLRADGAMGIALGTAPEGVAVARELGLRTRPTARYRLVWSGIAWIDRRRSRSRDRS